jgi:GNAT superfamily N-acetyltransferase
MTGPPDLRSVVREHVDAFNAHDTERLLRGFDEEISWHTGSDVVNGRDALRTVFDDWLWARAPRLEVMHLVVDGERAAMECVEHMVLEGQPVEFPIAAFFTAQTGLLTSMRVYREGSANLSNAAPSPRADPARADDVVVRVQALHSGPVCRRVLGELTEWFAIELAVDHYVDVADRSPTVIASLGGEDVGFLTTVQHSPYAAEIYVMGVRPAFRRRGVGRHLVESVEHRALAQGIEYLQVKSLSERRLHAGYAETRAFYLACGFRPLEEFPTLWGPENPALQLVKRLGR